MKGITLGISLALAALAVLPVAGMVFAAGDEPGEYVDRRVTDMESVL